MQSCLFSAAGAVNLPAVATEGARKPTCAQTGLAVPECSCGRCLEIMLHEYSPALLAAEIRVTAARQSRGDEPGTRHQPA